MLYLQLERELKKVWFLKHNREEIWIKQRQQKKLLKQEKVPLEGKQPKQEQNLNL